MSLEPASSEQSSAGFDTPDDDDLLDPPFVATLPSAELAQLVRDGERLTQDARSLTSRWVDKRLKRPPRS